MIQSRASRAASSGREVAVEACREPAETPEAHDLAEAPAAAQSRTDAKAPATRRAPRGLSRRQACPPGPRHRGPSRRPGPRRRWDSPGTPPFRPDSTSRLSPAATRQTAPRAAPRPSRSRTCSCWRARSVRTSRGTSHTCCSSTRTDAPLLPAQHGQAATAEPLGALGKARSQIRGHVTGHLLSGLALTYANTGDGQPGSGVTTWSASSPQLQAGTAHIGLPSATCPFPSSYFDWLEAGQAGRVAVLRDPQYLARMIDQYQLAAADQALDIAMKLADWVEWRWRLP